MMQPRQFALARALHAPDPLFTHGGGIVAGSAQNDIVLITSAALTI